MFDWIFDLVYKLLYGISKSIFQIIDGLLACANMLCGIEPIRYRETEVDFLTFLLRNKNISYGFVGAVLIGVILVFIFATFAVIRAISSEKDNMTPAQIFVKVGKTLLTFIFIPICVAVVISLTNIFMQSLYQATLGGSPDGLGRFLAGAFGMDARKDGVPEDFYLKSSFNYRSLSSVKDFIDISDYDFFFSYIAGIVILICLAHALLMFIDRAISIVILFIFSPISVSTAVIDDGQRFKLWRDQFLVKFLTGYGCIIAINIYTLIIAAITNKDLVFFDNSTLNNFMKIAIIVGGGVSMQRIMALVGNLISQGAGSNELRDNAIATAGMQRLGMRALGGAASAITSPFRATRSAANFVRDSRQFGTLTAAGQRLGLRTNRDYGQMSKLQKNQQKNQIVQSENYRRTGSFAGTNDNNKVRNSISGPSNNANNNRVANNNNNQGNANNKKLGNAMVENQILNRNKNQEKK